MTPKVRGSEVTVCVSEVTVCVSEVTHLFPQIANKSNVESNDLNDRHNDEDGDANDLVHTRESRILQHEEYVPVSKLWICVDKSLI